MYVFIFVARTLNIKLVEYYYSLEVSKVLFPTNKIPSDMDRTINMFKCN